MGSPRRTQFTEIELDDRCEGPPAACNVLVPGQIVQVTFIGSVCVEKGQDGVGRAKEEGMEASITGC